MAEPVDMILPMLKEMRAENLAEHGRTRLDLDDVKATLADITRRLESAEEVQLNQRRAMTADTLFSKLVTGEFEERIEQLEKKVRDLETQK